MLPLTYAVPLLQGIWNGDAWSAHLGDVAALAVVVVVCTALSATNENLDKSCVFDRYRNDNRDGRLIVNRNNVLAHYS
jgi:hypothetical protein